jgi:hypothetical protein
MSKYFFEGWMKILNQILQSAYFKTTCILHDTYTAKKKCKKGTFTLWDDYFWVTIDDFWCKPQILRQLGYWIEKVLKIDLNLKLKKFFIACLNPRNTQYKAPLSGLNQPWRKVWPSRVKKGTNNHQKILICKYLKMRRVFETVDPSQ